MPTDSLSEREREREREEVPTDQSNVSKLVSSCDRTVVQDAAAGHPPSNRGEMITINNTENKGQRWTSFEYVP